MRDLRVEHHGPRRVRHYLVYAQRDPPAGALPTLQYPHVPPHFPYDRARLTRHLRQRHRYPIDLLPAATAWARAEVFSALLFLAASLGFYRLGVAAVARAFVAPTLVAGVLLLAVGVGISVANGGRVTGFAEAYQTDGAASLATERARTERVLGEYRRIAFLVIPLVVVAAALVMLLVESDANARIAAYHDQLLRTQQTINH